MTQKMENNEYLTIYVITAKSTDSEHCQIDFKI